MDLFNDWADDSWQLMPEIRVEAARGHYQEPLFSGCTNFLPGHSIEDECLFQDFETGLHGTHVPTTLHQYSGHSFLQDTFSSSFTDEEPSMHANPGLAAPSNLAERLATNHDSSPNGGNSFDISEHQPGPEVDINQKLFSCPFCDVVSPSNIEHRRHLKSHGYICHECSRDYGSNWDLNNHSFITGHSAYSCIDCEATFSRFDVLKRHKDQHSAEPLKKYSCTHCKKWKAPNGFTRKDHLTQHLRNYHHIENSSEAKSKFWGSDTTGLGFHRYCIQEGCSFYRTKEETRNMYLWEDLFQTRSAFTKHMREAHDRSTYPCTKPGCKKVGGKGFFQKRDLMKHMKREHDIDLMAEDDVGTAAAPEVITNAPEAATSAPEIVSDGTETFDFQAFMAEEE